MFGKKKKKKKEREGIKMTMIIPKIDISMKSHRRMKKDLMLRPLL
jgi:hypothetical protein